MLEDKKYNLEDLSINDLHFMSHCIVYTLCCMHGLVEEALHSYNDARIELNNLGKEGINNLQKKIIETAGIELNKENVDIISQPIIVNNPSKLIQ